MKVYLGIGSNLGDRRGNCRRALKYLMQVGIKVVRESSMYDTAPWGFKDQPSFINMAVEAESVLSPSELLRVLKSIERDMGRVDAGKWGPRVIDLDILLYDDLVVSEPGLKVPHPLLQEREFVLRPLAEIAPHVLHPLLRRSISELLLSLTLRK